MSTFKRKGKTISGPIPNKYVGVFPSINAAKRASRALQIEQDGATGRGCLSVVDTRKVPVIGAYRNTRKGCYRI